MKEHKGAVKLTTPPLPMLSAIDIGKLQEFRFTLYDIINPKLVYKTDCILNDENVEPIGVNSDIVNSHDIIN